MSRFIDVIGSKFALTHDIKKINGCKVEIKNYLSADEYVTVVRSIADACFDKHGVYRPEYYELAKRYAIIDNFTDIDIGDITVEELFKDSQGGDWYYSIEKEVTNNSIWAEIEVSVSKQIEYIISKQETSFDKVCNKMLEILNSTPLDQTETIKDIKEVLNGLNKVNKDEFVKAVIDKHK